MKDIPLGKNVEYKTKYAPEVLFPIERKISRDQFGITQSFNGVDIWNCYEVSWLNNSGKPEVRILEIYISSTSEYLVESKSLKLYLFSLNNEKFASEEEVTMTIKNDLDKCLNDKVFVLMRKMDFFDNQKITKADGVCIDDIEGDFENLDPETQRPKIESDEIVHEKLFSNLHKTNCLITSQPDWATFFIEYKGKKISQLSLLQYIVSHRGVDMFHEQSVEKCFQDIMESCNPESLTIYARYTRRGGIDINPIRSTEKIQNIEELNFRLARQ